jgi:hypothetical protein
MSRIEVAAPICSGTCGMQGHGEPKLFSRARLAYERGRLIVALRHACVVLAAVALAVVFDAPKTFTVLCGGALTLTTDSAHPTEDGWERRLTLH